MPKLHIARTSEERCLVVRDGFFERVPTQWPPKIFIIVIVEMYLLLVTILFLLNSIGVTEDGKE